MAALGRSCQGIPAGPALEFPQAAAPDRLGAPGAAGHDRLQPPMVMMAGNGNDGASGSPGLYLQSSFDVASLAALGSHSQGPAGPPGGSCSAGIPPGRSL